MKIQRGPVAVSKDADIGLLLIEPGLRLFSDAALFIQYVAHGYLATASANDDSSGEPAFLIIIDIAGNNRDRSELPQALNDASVSNISCMKNFSHAYEMFFDSRIIEPMRISNHSDTKLPTLCYGVTPVCTPSDS